jgi:broad specificity phosphatase PhoE
VSRACLILVRHAAPEQIPDVPPPLWGLSEAGRAAAAALAPRLAALGPAHICASSEPKAIETAAIVAGPLGLPVDSDSAFDEHHRESWPFEPDPAAIRTRVLRVLAAPNLSIGGAETGTAAAARFAAGVGARSERPLLVTSHGTVLRLYVAQQAGLDAATLWPSFGLPEALVLDRQGRLVDRIA